MRRSYGRDLGLSVRMVVALAIVAAIYLLAGAAVLAVAVAALLDGDAGAALGGLVVAAIIPLTLVGQMRKSAQLVLRAVRAEPIAPAEEPELHALVARAAA